MRPTLHTDAYEDEVTRRVPIIMLAGPIRHWWTCWGSPEHEAYITHRNMVRSTLIEAGYLTYAPWDAIKGTWTEGAQVINDAAIRASDALIDLTPLDIPAHGTAAERQYAMSLNIPVVPVGLGITTTDLLLVMKFYVGEGVQYT